MIKQLFHIRQADESEATQQVLSIQVGEKHCGFAITNKTASFLYELAYYSVDRFESNPLAELTTQHARLRGPFYQVLISYDHPQSVLTPVQHYSMDEGAMLLKTIYGTNGLSTVISEQVNNWQLYNVYAIPKDLHEWVARQFSASSYWHQYTIELKNLGKEYLDGCFFIDFRADDFTLIAARGNDLLLAQTFPYSSSEDVLYSLLNVCQQQALSQSKLQLFLSGLIDEHSALYKDIYQYFIHVERRNAGWNIQQEDYPAHFFTSLNDLAKCAS